MQGGACPHPCMQYPHPPTPQMGGGHVQNLTDVRKVPRFEVIGALAPLT